MNKDVHCPFIPTQVSGWNVGNDMGHMVHMNQVTKKITKKWLLKLTKYLKCLAFLFCPYTQSQIVEGGGLDMYFRELVFRYLKRWYGEDRIEDGSS